MHRAWGGEGCRFSSSKREVSNYLQRFRENIRYPRHCQTCLITIDISWRSGCGRVKLSLAIIQIILAPARPVALVYIALHVHYAAVGGVWLPLKPLHRAVKKGRYAVQEHDVVLFGTWVITWGSRNKQKGKGACGVVSNL